MYDAKKYQKEADRRIKEFKPFLITTSKGEIKCDEEEVEKVIKAISTGSIAMLKQGLINPSFFVSIVRDEKRHEEYAREVRSVLQDNELYMQTGAGRGVKFIHNPKPLENIFEGMSVNKIGKTGAKELPST